MLSAVFEVVHRAPGVQIQDLGKGEGGAGHPKEKVVTCQLGGKNSGHSGSKFSDCFS